MIRSSFKICVLSGLAFMLASCKGEDRSVEQPDTTSFTTNQWIDKTMRSNYLWTSEIPEDSKLDLSADPETFFYTLLSSKDGKTRSGGSHYYYSYIEKNSKYTATKTSIDAADTYGMEFTRFQVVDENSKATGNEYDQVIYVLPKSPAEEAGLQRGDLIIEIDGSEINISNGDFSKLLNGTAHVLQMYKGGVANASTSVSLGASRAVVDDPLFYHSVITIGSHKVAYLVYNHFTTGPDGFEDDTYNKEMKTVVSDFANQGVTDFILDLRYNGGGYLTSAELMAGLLVPAADRNDIFCKLTDNQGTSATQTFSESSLLQGAGSLTLNKNQLYVLVSGSTASASEAVINGLSPYMTVTLIGEQTEGKNVGSENYADDAKYAYDFQPITFYITSKAGNDYSTGFTPNYLMNEFDQSENSTILPLGDTNEYLLNKALSLITNTTKSLQPKSVSLGVTIKPMKVIGTSLKRHETNGVLLVR